MSSYDYLSRSMTFLPQHNLSISGRGEQTVVLGNGFGTDKDIWNNILPWLEERFRVVRFDWTIDPRHYDAARYSALHGYAEDLLALVSATGSAPCSFIAHSMSGMIGMLAARIEPGFFRRMVMLAPSPRYIDDGTYRGGFSQGDIDDLLRAMGDNYVEWARHFSPLAVADVAGGAAATEFNRSLTAMRPDVALSMALTIFKMDMRDHLDGFVTPTTIVQTRHDIAVPVEVARYLHARWPNSRLEIIEASGHMPQLTSPDQVIGILEKVLV
jgi:Predicted hydrolases or acyltransferases (alpha/beta hydrolase superfamily)